MHTLTSQPVKNGRCHPCNPGRRGFPAWLAERGTVGVCDTPGTCCGSCCQVTAFAGATVWEA